MMGDMKVKRMRLLVGLVLGLSCLMGGSVYGQVEAGKDGGKTPANHGTPTPPPKPVAPPKELESPNATIMTFLKAANEAIEAQKKNDKEGFEKAIADAVACMDTSELKSEDRQRNLVAKLFEVFNKLGEFKPKASWHKAALDLEAKKIASVQYFPDKDNAQFEEVFAGRDEVKPKGSVVLERQKDGRWLFSAKTVAEIDGLASSLEALERQVDVDAAEIAGSSFWLRTRMPAAWKGPDHMFMGVEYWQWMFLLIFIFVGVVIDYTFRAIVRSLITRWVKRRGGEVDKEKMRLAVRPIGLLVMSLFWLGVVHLLDLNDTAHLIVQGAARVFAVFASVWAAWRLTDLLCDAWLSMASKTETKFDDVLVPLVRKSLKIFITVFGVLYIGVTLKLNIWPALTALGIGGVGFAFAAKDTLENFFGSATVLIDQPFGIGDWVVMNDVEGTVEEIGFRSTRVRTFYNSLVTVPNANLVRAVVDNYGHRKYRRWKCHIGITYDTPVEKVVAFTEGLRELVRVHPYTRKDYFQVYLNQFGPSSLDILIYLFFETPDWSTELRERERLMLDMMRLADQLGVEFAFPTQTLHMYQEEHGGVHEPGDTPTSMTDRRAMVKGIRAVKEITKDQPWVKEAPGPVEFLDGPTELSDDDDTQIENRTAGS